MPSCASCGAERLPGAEGSACAKCGARSVPELELEAPSRRLPRPAAANAEEADLKIELAADPRSTRRGAQAEFDEVQSAIEPVAYATALVRERVGEGGRESLGASARYDEIVGDVAFDARLLADYGRPPRHWVLTPLYAWRVLTRRRDLKKGLLGRREEAARAAHEVEDALVAFAERSRQVAANHPAFAQWFEALGRAEDVLRSRDQVLASEQDAQSARLASVDARLAKLEGEVVHAQNEERSVAADLASIQAALARSESKLKRAEAELRAAQQREADEGQE